MFGNWVCTGLRVTVLSFSLTYLKVETWSAYPGICNWVPGARFTDNVVRFYHMIYAMTKVMMC